AVCGCGAPTRLHFAELNQEHINEIAFSVGKTVQYTCRPGYAKHPGMSPTITCLESGVWSEALEFCKTGCNAPTQLEFAELKELYGNQTVFPVGRTVEYVCRPGYAQHPGMPPAITCLRNQTWSAALEFCKRKKCPNPGDPENGRAVVLTDLLFGSKPGYSLAGEPSIFCTTVDGEHGVWSGPPPRCGEVTCPPPPGIANGNHSGQPSDSHLPGSAVQYSCRDGYSLIGNASISCTAKGTWSRPQPRCEGLFVVASFIFPWALSSFLALNLIAADQISSVGQRAKGWKGKTSPICPPIIIVPNQTLVMDNFHLFK
uniref:Sushi domain-containing protein n=1 Tax=Athene cunicularia TaxID=194338 RepID=A0A663MDK0_ATHCN